MSHWNCLPISSWQTLRSTWETRWEELQAAGGSEGSLRWLLLAELYSIIAICKNIIESGFFFHELHVQRTKSTLCKWKQGQRSISPFAKGIEGSGRRKNRGNTLGSSTNLLCYTVHHQSCGLRVVVKGRVWMFSCMLLYRCWMMLAGWRHARCSNCSTRRRVYVIHREVPQVANPCIQKILPPFRTQRGGLPGTWNFWLWGWETTKSVI